MPHQQPVTAARKTATEKSVPNLGRHTRKCAICNHPDRASIDSDFISWRSATTITLDYELSSRSIIYRHAAATGLLPRRQRNFRGVCERIIERVDEAPPSASTVLRALRIYAQITDDGHWLEPAKRSIVTHIHITKHEQLPASARGEAQIAAMEPHPIRCESTVATDSPARGKQPDVRKDAAGYGESAPNSVQATSGDSSPEITVNTRWNKRLPWNFDPEILTGTQNVSREEANAIDQST